MALSISFGSVLKLHRQLNTVVVCAKKNRGSRDDFSWKKKRPRKRHTPRHENLGDISVLYSNSGVVEHSDKLLKDCTRHISDYVENCNLPAAEKVFSLMIEKGVKPNVYTYTALMKGYSLVGNYERVCELLAEMEKKGVKPSVVTFSNAIQSYTMSGDLEGAESLFRKMKDVYGLDPNAYTYTSLLNVCLSARDLKTARRLFEEMNSSDTKQDRVTMNTMIDVYAECSNKKNGRHFLVKCRKLMEDMEGKGVLANERTYSTLLKLCARGNLTPDAMNILNEMRANRLRPDVVSYNTVLDGISKDQKLSSKEVLQLSSIIVDKMKNEGVRHDAMSFTSLINIALRVGDLYRVKRLFKEMKTLKVEPTGVTYATMIKCYEKLGNPKKGEAYLKPCLDLLDECEQEGTQMDAEGYTSLLSACAKTSNLDQALKIWNRIKEKKVETNVILFNAMINACLSTDDGDMAFDFLNGMKASGIKPNVVTYGTFMSYFFRKKDRSGAEKILAEMKMYGVQPDKFILRMLKALGIE